jgi:hypothetical protein
MDHLLTVKDDIEFAILEKLKDLFRLCPGFPTIE